eukprot:scaffold6861_cov120-Isochrysis_galbana.AAC.5
MVYIFCERICKRSFSERAVENSHSHAVSVRYCRGCRPVECGGQLRTPYLGSGRRGALGLMSTLGVGGVRPRARLISPEEGNAEGNGQGEHCHGCRCQCTRPWAHDGCANACGRGPFRLLLPKFLLQKSKLQKFL